MAPLSVFIIAQNEADRIGATLGSVAGLADDVVVVDSGSTDGTPQVAEQYGARVLFNPWPGYGLQKRFGEDASTGGWLLNLDADEVLSPELREEIAGLFAAGEPPCAAYRLRIAEIFPGETKPHRWAYALSPVRLYRKSAGRYSASPVHDRVDLAPGVKTGRLKGTVYHYSVRSMGDQIAKLNRYSDDQVADLAARGKKLSTLRVFLEFPAAFFKAYLLRRHCLRGVYGFITAMNYAYFRYLRVAKHYERVRLERLKDGAAKPGAPAKPH
ncbi:MAG: glycosyltransferase family 2 protein [Methylobacteriaceae bacterium]|jgi:glycosyltransferase involved in cell wall biosynthesis|nr:glycosyltransferase family 2 protein [Methylobacteriaceae bacterium]